MMKTPVFRKSERSASGGWVKSRKVPMKYATYAFYIRRIGLDLGSEEDWTTYCLRRGHVNAILGQAPDAVVDQIMRHDPLTGCMQNAYLNRRVGFNTQDAYLERDPTADGLTRAFTHMSIRCNPEVPKEIPKAELDRLPPDPDVIELTRKVKQMSMEIRQKSGFINAAPKHVQRDYKKLRQDLRNAEKAFKDAMSKVYREACRRRMHNEELERQLKGVAMANEVEPVIQHHLLERTQLQVILCDFNTKLSTADITERKIRAVDHIVRLASRREIRQRQQSLSPSHGERREVSPDRKPAPQAKEVPLILEKTQCIYCVGDEQLPYTDRIRTFSRVSHMMDHVERVHLRHEPTRGRLICRHPKCKDVGDLESLNHFKNHVQRVHGVKLRA